MPLDDDDGEDCTTASRYGALVLGRQKPACLLMRDDARCLGGLFGRQMPATTI